MKDTTIPVSKKTLKFVQDYKKEFGFHSLDESVENAVKWGRAFAYIDSRQRRSMLERINALEEQFGNLRKLLTYCLTSIFMSKNKGEKKKDVK